MSPPHVHTFLPLLPLHYTVFLRQTPHCQETVVKPQSLMKSHVTQSSTRQEASHPLRLLKAIIEEVLCKVMLALDITAVIKVLFRSQNTKKEARAEGSHQSALSGAAPTVRRQPNPAEVPWPRSPQASQQPSGKAARREARPSGSRLDPARPAPRPRRLLEEAAGLALDAGSPCQAQQANRQHFLGRWNSHLGRARGARLPGRQRLSARSGKRSGSPRRCPVPLRAGCWPPPSTWAASGHLSAAQQRSGDRALTDQ